MASRARVWLLVISTYGLARLAVHVLVGGSWTINLELRTHMLVVPIAQLLVLEVLGRVLRKRVWLEDSRQHR
jgi:hypothetical protein